MAKKSKSKKKKQKKVSRSRARAKSKSRSAGSRAVARPEPVVRMRPASAEALGLQELHLSFTTKNPQAVMSFYREVLGFTPHQGRGKIVKPGHSVHDEKMGYLYLRVTRDGSVGFHDFNIAYQLVVQYGGKPPDEPYMGSLYLMVRDVNKVYERLSRRGVQFEKPPSETPWMHRVVTCFDPDGRKITFAQVLTK